jgi:hypothetical protein
MELVENNPLLPYLGVIIIIGCQVDNSRWLIIGGDD